MSDLSRYQQALDYLENFIDYSRTYQENIAPENFELARMVRLLEVLGNPHQSFPSIHVAGTKGKGSVSALCASTLRAAGYSVGLYTSPHLQDFRERIQVDGEMIEREIFADLVDQMRPVVPTLSGLTAYELQTALAFLYFAKMNIDIAVVEVGLGGRLDSTNVIIPLVSVITSISLDHTFVLGNTLAEIAGEKGGIIKPNVPIVSALQPEDVTKTLQEIAKQQNTPFYQVGVDIQVQLLENNLAGQRIRLIDGDFVMETELGLLGMHQIENAALAFGVLLQLDKGDTGFAVPEKAIQKGFAEAQWPGRFEVLDKAPYVILDGAHNQDSMRRLVESLSIYFPEKSWVVLFGASVDKDIAGMFNELLPYIDTLIVTQSSHPRATPVAELQALATGLISTIISQANPPKALRAGMALAKEKDGVLIVTGSLYHVGEIRELWFG